MTINHSPRKEKKHMTEIIISCFKKREKKKKKAKQCFSKVMQVDLQEIHH